MRAIVLLLASCLALVAGLHQNPQRIVGGSVTTIEEYPSIASLLYSWTGINHIQTCGGTIINNRAILTAAHCIAGNTINQWQIRVGSTNANSGGFVHTCSRFIIHESYNQWTSNNDIAIMHTPSAFAFGNSVRPASIAGSNYELANNQAVWAAGWGAVFFGGSNVETLRHVQIRTVNQVICASRYSGIVAITPNMLCSGHLDIGGRDQCHGDSGGPLYHNNVLVGVCSFGYECARAFYPGVNARVSRYTDWIQANA